MQKNETRSPFTPHTRRHSKWIKDVSARPKAIKINEENAGSKISDIAHSNIFLSLQARETKEKINKTTSN